MASRITVNSKTPSAPPRTPIAGKVGRNSVELTQSMHSNAPLTKQPTIPDSKSTSSLPALKPIKKEEFPSKQSSIFPTLASTKREDSVEKTPISANTFTSKKADSDALTPLTPVSSATKRRSTIEEKSSNEMTSSILPSTRNESETTNVTCFGAEGKAMPKQTTTGNPEERKLVFPTAPAVNKAGSHDTTSTMSTPTAPPVYRAENLKDEKSSSTASPHMSLKRTEVKDEKSFLTAAPTPLIAAVRAEPIASKDSRTTTTTTTIRTTVTRKDNSNEIKSTVSSKLLASPKMEPKKSSPSTSPKRSPKGESIKHTEGKMEKAPFANDKLVLTYFGYRGRAESIRLMLEDNGVSYNEHVVFEKDWATIKDIFPFGQIPVLRVNQNTNIPQTGAILRYLARKLGLHGSTTENQTFADVICEGARDLYVKYYKLIYEEFEEGKASYIQQLPKSMKQFENLLAKSEYGGPFILGKQITFADYALYDLLDVHQVLDPECLNDNPKLKGHFAAMNKRPKIKEYLKNRRAKNLPINGNGKM